MTEYVSKGATISKCGRYRYRLWREWRGTHDRKNWRWLTDSRGRVEKDGAGFDLGEPLACTFIMLNPSTADGSQDDATIRKCVSFAKRWKYERLEVVNLFAFRATDPKALLALNHSDDPVGPDNLDHVEQATLSTRCGLVVAAWGVHGRHLEQHQQVWGWTGRDHLLALGFTKAGDPRHPLYVRGDVELQEYRP